MVDYRTGEVVSRAGNWWGVVLIGLAVVVGGTAAFLGVVVLVVRRSR